MSVCWLVGSVGRGRSAIRYHKKRQGSYTSIAPIGVLASYMVMVCQTTVRCLTEKAMASLRHKVHGFITSQGTYMISSRHQVHGFITSQGTWFHYVTKYKAGKLHFHLSYRSTCFLHGYGLSNYGQVFDREGHDFITSQGTWLHYVTRYMVSLRHKVHGCITSQGTWFHCVTRYMLLFYNHFCTFSCYN